jgi:DNA-binding GntR family transcriptional regulator
MTALKPIALGSLSDEAFEKIVQAISTGEFPPGTKLSEADLARKFGISRGPLREALGRLEGLLVERRPRLGVSVIQLNEKDIQELFAVREALEGMACRLAAVNATETQLSQLSALLEKHSHDESVLNESGYFQKTSDNDFHFQIVRCARNGRLAEMLLEGIYYQLRLHRFRSSARPGRAKTAFREHKRIVKALIARDPDEAEAMMRAHIRSALEGIMPETHAEAEEAKVVKVRRSRK